MWDFDGTFYQDPNVGQAIKTQYLRYLKKNGLTLTEESFDSLSQHVGSWGKAASILADQTEIKILEEIDKSFKIEQHLKPNKKTVRLVENLSEYRHIILSNSSEKHVRNGLKKIGFNQSKKTPFEKIFCRDQTKTLKPDSAAFKKVIAYTQLPADHHLMIGDSFHHDIQPALSLGMQAVLIEDLKAYLDNS